MRQPATPGAARSAIAVEFHTIQPRRLPNLPNSAGLLKVFAGLAVIAVLIGSAPYFTVSQNERTVVTDWGKVSYLAAPGFHVRIPVVQAITPMPISVRSIQLDDLNTYTIDSQELEATIVLQYRIPVGRVLDVYSNLGPDYALRLRSMVIDRFKTVIGTVNAIDLASQRGRVALEVLKSIRTDAARLYDGIEITDFQFINYNWNDAYRTAISNASVAKARVDQQEQEKRQAEVSAEQAVVEAKGRANAQIATAEGDGQSRRIHAIADAYAVQLAGTAAAGALKAQNEALNNNPNLVAIQWAQRWNGQLPTSMFGSSPVPLVMGGK